ncbi:lipase family protein [Gordonia soli]|nr:lipase family protein [Gordonia soli]
MRIRLRSAAIATSLAVVAGGGAVAMDAPAVAAPAGSVLSRSAVASDLLPAHAATGTKVLYRTRDQAGRDALSTGVFYTPRGTAPAGGWPVVSWAHGTTGIADRCAPSLRKRGGANEAPLDAALAAGYAVTATDYSGLGAPGTAEYLAGRSAAYSVIDMIRAARTVDGRLSNRWVSLGHSQGGHAALFAARYALYAPELALRGTVALAPAAYLENLLPALAPGVPDVGKFNGFSALFLYLLSGLDHARPDLDVPGYLTGKGREYLERARQLCVTELRPVFQHVAPGSLVARPFIDPRFSAALRDYTSIPATGWSTPIRIEQGTADQTVMPLSTTLLTAQLRAGGASVTEAQYPGADHMGVVTRAVPDIIRTVQGYFARR